MYDLDVEMENGVPVIKNLAKAREAIGNVESRGSGDYAAIGPRTRKGDRAYGRYQVMGENLPSWTKATLGRSLTPTQFLADKGAQDAVFNKYFGESAKKYGNFQDAASIWFTGKPMAQGANRRDVTGTTGNQYVDKFNAEMGGPPRNPGSIGTYFGGQGAPAGGLGAPPPSQVQSPIAALSGQFGEEEMPGLPEEAPDRALVNQETPAMGDLTGGVEDQVASIAVREGALPSGWSPSKIREAAQKYGISPEALVAHLRSQG